MHVVTDRVRRGALMTLQAALATLALVEGANAVRHAFEELAGHHTTLLLGGVQLLGGLLFLWPRTMRIGGWALFIVFAHSALYQIWHADFPAESLVFAAATFFLTVQGASKRAPAAPSTATAEPQPEPQ